MSQRPPTTLPSHETLSRLAQEQPQSFESLRLELIEDFFNRAPEPIHLRLRQLQFRIDGIRRLSQSPLGASIRIQALMWDSFVKMNDELQEFMAQAHSPLVPETASLIRRRSAHGAAVLQFQPRRPKTPAPGKL